MQITNVFVIINNWGNSKTSGIPFNGPSTRASKWRSLWTSLFCDVPVSREALLLFLEQSCTSQTFHTKWQDTGERWPHRKLGQGTSGPDPAPIWFSVSLKAINSAVNVIQYFTVSQNRDWSERIKAAWRSLTLDHCLNLTEVPPQKDRFHPYDGQITWLREKLIEKYMTYLYLPQRLAWQSHFHAEMVYRNADSLSSLPAWY